MALMSNKLGQGHNMGQGQNKGQGHLKFKVTWQSIFILAQFLHISDVLICMTNIEGQGQNIGQGHIKVKVIWRSKFYYFCKSVHVLMLLVFYWLLCEAGGGPLTGRHFLFYDSKWVSEKLITFLRHLATHL